MQGPQFVFIFLPAIAAVGAGWLVRHWSLAAAAFFGGMCWLFVVPRIGGDARFLTPLFTGTAVAGLALLPLLLIRQDVSVWTRMTIALVAAVGTHAVFLQYAMASR